MLRAADTTPNIQQPHCSIYRIFSASITKGIKAAFYLSLVLSHGTSIANTWRCPNVLPAQIVTWKTTIECTVIEAPLNYWIETPGDVTFRATDQVILGEGFSIGEGAEFQIIMVNDYTAFYCGTSCH